MKKILMILLINYIFQKIIFKDFDINCNISKKYNLNTNKCYENYLIKIYDIYNNEFIMINENNSIKFFHIIISEYINKDNMYLSYNIDLLKEEIIFTKKEDFDLPILYNNFLLKLYIEKVEKFKLYIDILKKYYKFDIKLTNNIKNLL